MSMNSELPQIGERIRFLRRSRNWTLADLAGRIGIKEGPLGRIELGKNLPSAKVLYNLSKVFDVSVDYLFNEDAHYPPSASSLEKKDIAFVMLSPDDENEMQRSLLSACQDMIKAFHSLEGICNVPRYARLPLSIPFDHDYDGMDRLACQMRSYFGIGDAIVFDYFELFETFGLRVMIFPFTRGAEEIRSVSFYDSLESNAFFFINARHNPERQLFSLALELGKILISNRMKLLKADLFKESQEPASKEIRPINPSRAAKRFASSFLMPASAVKSTVEQLGISNSQWTWELLLRIKNRFGVSAETFLYRLKELKAISPEVLEALKKDIYIFYDKNGMIEPGLTRRSQTPNGRFFDLCLAAEAIGWKGGFHNKEEQGAISEVVSQYKVVTK
ncbi:Helix-turn-helix domain protein [Desulfamplus magnetovallimortis]|uniref:Helix-turn-helix domain protein n=1 Tax=Desulfamplus magnetovallimortis TaxID=1246637 RepID=A0A1W1HI06_9BACT|nr:XRE family transcriptional regulator [Desulfamplus magnetovallimortis]SLM32022.1 Helix-turn-helix domain protein [Desulfamplus magnetovallimortis]